MMIARLSPRRSANAPKSGVAIPHAKFWIAIASENSLRNQPKSAAIGIWNTPKLARMVKLRNRTILEAIRIGVKTERDGVTIKALFKIIRTRQDATR